MKEEIRDKHRVDHILDAITEVEKYLANVSYNQFQHNSEKRFATLKQIEIIGEACNNISSGLKQLYPEIEWSSIKGFRNISIHEYFDIKLPIVWEIAKNDLPVLKKQFTEIKKERKVVVAKEKDPIENQKTKNNLLIKKKSSHKKGKKPGL